MKLRAATVAIVEVVLAWLLPKPPTGAHSLGKPGTVYVWAIFNAVYGTETTQEIQRQAVSERGDRSRSNGFLTVGMALRGES